MWLRLVHDHRFSFEHVPEATVVYHRIPGGASMTRSAATQAATLAQFAAQLRRIWARWPPRSQRAARFRLYLAVMYWQALARHVTGQQVSTFYYHRTMRAIFGAWTGGLNPKTSSPTGSPPPWETTVRPPSSPERLPAALPPGALAALASRCPGICVERVLRDGGKSVLATGRVGDQPVVVKILADAAPLWQARQRHEIEVYEIFAGHPPPVRVPKLVCTDGERVLVLERIDGTPLDTDRYPARILTSDEVHAATALVTALAGWQPLPGGFMPVFDYPSRIARYHSAGYFGDADRAALGRLLARCGEPRQLCHGDPLPDNMLITPAGEWALLDWEFTGLFLPGFDLAMLHTLLTATPAARDHIETLVTEAGEAEPFLVNLAVVLSRERRIHRELPGDHPLRQVRLRLIETAWTSARDRIHAAAGRP